MRQLKSQRMILRVGGLLSLLVLSACTVFPESPPRAQTHDLGPPAKALASPPALSGGLVLRSMQAPPWLRDTRVVYRREDIDATQVQAYSRRRWVAPPPALLEQRLAERLAPVMTTDPEAGRYHLYLSLDRFEQVFTGETSAEVVVRLRVVLRDTAQPGHSRKRVFDIRQAAPGADGRGAVTGLSEATDALIEALAAWLDESARA